MASADDRPDDHDAASPASDAPADREASADDETVRDDGSFDEALADDDEPAASSKPASSSKPAASSKPASSKPASTEPASTEAKPPSKPAASPPEAAAEPEGPPRRRRYTMVAIVTVVLLALDLISKQWAWDNLREGAVRTVVDGWVYFEFGFNTGSAFSLLRDASWSRMLFIGITVAALAYMVHLARSLPTRFGSAFVAIAMVASGALGNLHDRFVRTMIVDGVERYGVVDFIKVFYWKGKPWPTFNIADVALVGGVGLLLWFLLRHGEVLDAPREKDSA